MSRLPFSNNVNLLVYFMGTLLFMESLLRFTTVGGFLSIGFLISVVYSIIVALIFFMVSSLFASQKANYVTSVVLLILAAMIFTSQFLYYQFFRTFYSVYSMTQYSQVFEFRQDIGAFVIQYFHWILLYFLPVFIIVATRNRWFVFMQSAMKFRIALVAGVVFLYLMSITTIHAAGKGVNSPYDLYFNSSNPALSTDRLGMITTMRLDLQRLATGWTPRIDPATLKVVAANGNSNPKDDNTEAEIEIERSYNVLDIDFNSLIENESDEALKSMHQYFANVEPTAKNEYTGIYEGYNLVLITAESFAPYAVHKDVTPTLYKLVHEGYHFTDFYVPLWNVSTTDGEYVKLTGLIPKSGVWSFSQSANNDLPFVMGNQFKSLGYNTVAYHNHTYTYYDRGNTHPNMGYDYYGVGSGLEVTDVWPASDLEMMEQSIPDYIDKQPFHAYYMTVSGHMQYSFIGNSMAHKNRHYVEDLPYNEQGQAYLATQIELDKALRYLLDQLEEAGIADNTLIVLSSDHYPYGLNDETINELNGHTVEENFELHKSPLIIYTKGMEPKVIDRPSSSLDIVPTLSNLFGLEHDSRLLMGRDIFSDSDPLVIFNNRSFITDKGKYNAVTNEFIANDGLEVDEDYIETMMAIVNSKFYFSALMLDTNYYQYFE
ncbi:LTA synthase family protein [Desulfuribacillus alkaliarsenatis]|uniref:Sulfatase N-terminal domain-containing protein n=1 Tax=Desulfuribacillus alkaliarsenatis TaxID=766136 RepID=A0A1E5G3V6_9FIRM|nr:alkaline phosphatase family protein [Desulfuribacillus alkaliarsenatis]OEF97349.1 hypothetical protein BHF68_03825 [Desulfuribacillus alkaliarsenatis]